MMNNYCPECGRVDHFRVEECPHLTDKEKKLWEKAHKRGYKTGYYVGYECGEIDGKQSIRNNN